MISSVTSTFLFPQMTPGELKFAILVESLLNTIPDPEYRQLVVEVLMVCALWVGLNPDERFSGTLVIDDLITDANNLFLDYQVLRVLIVC